MRSSFLSSALPLHLLSSSLFVPFSRFSSSTTTSTTPLKDQLRALFRIVHPDFFQDAPYERDCNETSFKILQEYLQQSSDETARSKPAHIRFYLRRDICADAAESPFRLVDIHLPAPIFLSRSAQMTLESLAPPTRRALGKLLTACGIANPTPTDADDSSSYQTMDARIFLQQAAEASRLVGSAPSNELSETARRLASARRMAHALSALRMARGIRVLLPQSIPTSNHDSSLPDRVLDLVRLLDQHFDDTTSKMQGLTMILHNHAFGYSVASSTIYLSLRDPPEAWRAQLHAVPMAALRDHSLERRERRSLESRVARALGVGQWSAHGALLMQPEYRKWLLLILENAGQEGKIIGLNQDDSGSIVIAIDPPSSSSSSSSSPSTPESAFVDPASGLLHLAPSLAPTHVRHAIASLAPLAIRTMRQKNKDRDDLTKLIQMTRNRLKLNKLSMSSDLTMEEKRAGCHRLLEHSKHLVNITESLSIELARENAITPDGTIQLAIHFHL